MRHVLLLLLLPACAAKTGGLERLTIYVDPTEPDPLPPGSTARQVAMYGDRATTCECNDERVLCEVEDGELLIGWQRTHDAALWLPGDDPGACLVDGRLVPLDLRWRVQTVDPWWFDEDRVVVPARAGMWSMTEVSVPDLPAEARVVLTEDEHNRCELRSGRVFVTHDGDFAGPLPCLEWPGGGVTALLARWE